MTVNHEDDCHKNNRLSNFSFKTAIDNWRDAYLKGLMRHGSEHANAKITESQAYEILALYGKRCPNQIGREYGITATAVRYLWKGKNWAHLQHAATTLPRRRPILVGNELPHAILNPDKIRKIRGQKGKVNPKILAEQYGVSHWTIYSVWSGKSWSHVE